MNDWSPIRGPTSRKTVAKTTFPFWEERCRCVLQEFSRFRDLKQDQKPEIEILGHRHGEHGVWMGNREIGVIDYFSLRVH